MISGADALKSDRKKCCDAHNDIKNLKPPDDSEWCKKKNTNKRDNHPPRPRAETVLLLLPIDFLLTSREKLNNECEFDQRLMRWACKEDKCLDSACVNVVT